MGAAANSLLPYSCCCFSSSSRASLQFSSPASLRFSSTNTNTNTKLQCYSRLRCSSHQQSHTQTQTGRESTSTPPPPGLLDDFLLTFFRTKMVQELGWDSDKPGYDGLIEVANRLMKGKSNQDTQLSAVRVLRSLFPTWLLVLFKMLVAPIANGKVASMMVARATALSCKWLMGPCSVNSVVLPDGNSCSTGVFVERCRYLEESKCIGICINTCKIPTQTFFKDYMGVELYMEPNFEDYSCQFNFGVPAVSPAVDKALKEPCLEICTNANRRRMLGRKESDITECPQL